MYRPIIEIKGCDTIELNCICAYDALGNSGSIRDMTEIMGSHCNEYLLGIPRLRHQSEVI